jgi:3'-5' exoribonuclease
LIAVTPERAGAARLEASLAEALREIEDHSLSALLANVFDEETRRLFLSAPAAVQRHGCFPGGLAFHTLEVRRVALELALIGGGSSCDLDLLAAGALVHDIGKIEEMEYSAEQGQVVYRSDPPLGRLYGHMVCGVLRIYREALDLGIQDAPKVQQLIHLLVSHHGKPEWGAPVPPSTPEARLLHAADQCASEVEVTLDVLDRVNTRIDGEWLDGGHGRPRLYRGFVTG